MKRIFKCRKCKYEFIVRAAEPQAEVDNATGKDTTVPESKIRCPKCNAELLF